MLQRKHCLWPLLILRLRTRQRVMRLREKNPRKQDLTRRTIVAPTAALYLSRVQHLKAGLGR